jgi:hypothetical protein
MGSCISKPEEVKIVEQKVDKPSQSTDFAEDKRDAYVNWGKNPSDYIYR